MKGNALPVFYFSRRSHGFYEVYPSLSVLRHWIVFALELSTPYGVALVLVVHHSYMVLPVGIGRQGQSSALALVLPWECCRLSIHFCYFQVSLLEASLAIPTSFSPE